MRIKFIHYLKSLSRLANLSIITMHFPFEQPETQYIIKLTQLNQLAQALPAAVQLKGSYQINYTVFPRTAQQSFLLSTESTSLFCQNLEHANNRHTSVNMI